MKKLRSQLLWPFLFFIFLCQTKLYAQNEYLRDQRIDTMQYRFIPNHLLRPISPVNVNVINDKVYLWDDVYLGDTGYLNQFNRIMSGSRRYYSAGVNNNFIYNTRWPNGVIPFKIMRGFSESEEKTIRKAMNHIMRKTHVCFVLRSNEENYIKIKKVSKEELGFTGGQSHLGMYPQGSQNLLISKNDFGVGLIIHELGHAIGLIHEHCRNDRDEFVKIMYENVIPKQHGQFTVIPFFATDYGRYDYYSIMHYKPFNFSDNGEQTIVKLNDPRDQSFGGSDTLTKRDIRGINAMYPVERRCSYLPEEGSLVSPDELRLNQTQSVYVYAKNAHNFVDIFVRAGQKFTFTAASDDYWKNAANTWFEYRTNARGKYGDGGQALSRHPDIRILALTGELFSDNENIFSYTGTYFKIGLSKTWTAPRDGYLQLFANDILVGGYSDNAGKIKVRIKRIR